jgi:2-polyprenyl-3-methyl-5-hydroxy-6-metoxy-1,4-benzoquinol methylase
METILARQETHDWIADALSKEKRGSVLDVPAGSGAFGLRLKKIGFSVSCCDINPSGFSAEGIEIKEGDLNQSLPYLSESFDFITCMEGLDHLENPFNAIREFQRRSLEETFCLFRTISAIGEDAVFLITGLFQKIPSPKNRKDRFDHLWMLTILLLIYLSSFWNIQV